MGAHLALNGTATPSRAMNFDAARAAEVGGVGCRLRQVSGTHRITFACRTQTVLTFKGNFMHFTVTTIGVCLLGLGYQTASGQTDEKTGLKIGIKAPAF